MSLKSLLVVLVIVGGIATAVYYFRSNAYTKLIPKQGNSSISPNRQDSVFCGGIANIPCPSNYHCTSEGNYPDAGMICVPYEELDADGDCIVGGCNSELCSEIGDELTSICLYKPEYSCYKSAVCERQDNGQCGWTLSEELTLCLELSR